MISTPDMEVDLRMDSAVLTGSSLDRLHRCRSPSVVGN